MTFQYLFLTFLTYELTFQVIFFSMQMTRLKKSKKSFFFIILCKLVVMYRPSEMVNMVFDCGNKYVLFYSSNRPSDVHNWIRHTCAIPLIGHFLSLNVEATWNFRPYIQYITITLFFYLIISLSDGSYVPNRQILNGNVGSLHV